MDPFASQSSSSLPKVTSVRGFSGKTSQFSGSPGKNVHFYQKILIFIVSRFHWYIYYKSIINGVISVLKTIYDEGAITAPR